MKKKKGVIIFVAVLIALVGSFLIRNLQTYYSLKKHTGYTYGTIIKVWNENGWYSRYQFAANGKNFTGLQGGKYDLKDTVLIVYDTTKPRFSMIARYYQSLVLDSHNKIINLDTSFVRIDWMDYLPGDGIHSIKDLWLLD